jgi:methyl-accepting chemotaxis protein
MKTDTLYFKVNAASGIISIVIVIVFSLILYPFEIKRYNLNMKNIGLLLDTVFQNKYEDIANELFAGQKRALAVTLGEILKVQGITKVSVYMPDGKLFLAGGKTGHDTMTLSELEVLKHSDAFVISDHKDRSLRTYSRKIKVAGEKVGYIKLYYDLSELKNEVRLTIVIFLTLLLATLFLVSFLLNLFLSRFVIRPIFLLRNAVRKVEQGHLGETVALDSEDEIGDLGDAFNRMSVRLYESQSAIRKAEEKYRGIFEKRDGGNLSKQPRRHFHQRQSFHGPYLGL